MKRAIKTAFESSYGFQSSGFFVDSAGNITANTVTTNVDLDAPADFTVSTITGNSFVGISPTATLTRTATYVFDLELVDDLRFAILNPDQITLFNTGVRHSDGSVGSNAQNKTSGKLIFTVPINAPDTLFYGDSIRGIIGNSIQVVNPEGVFSAISIDDTLSVNGIASFNDNVNIIGSLDVSGNDVILNPTNEIVLSVNDGVIATVNPSGLEITNINIESGNITDKPTENTHIANKQYVDATSTALAIALGS